MVKFRGKTKNVFLDKLRDDGKETQRWVYGYYCKVKSRHFIILDDAEIFEGVFGKSVITGFLEVIPSTIAQFTGLKDKNDKEGFKSDIVRFFKDLYVIEWSICNACFYLKNVDEQQPDLAINNLLVGEIIGNQTDNKDLLENHNG